VAGVLHRAPPVAVETGRSHLARMLASRGLKDSPVFVVDEGTLSDDGLLEPRQVIERPLLVGGRDDLTLRGDVYDISKACLSELHLYDAPIRLTVWSDIPFASGLSSSSALVCATLKALSRYAGRSWNRYQFAEVARSIELNRMGVICGYQDFYKTSFGGLNYMDFRDKEFYREVDQEPYAAIECLNADAIDLPSLPFVLAHTGIVHSSGAVHKPIRERWLEGDREVRDAYVRIGQLAREGKLDPVIGRATEIERVIQILSRRTKNNPALIGEPGVGKTAIAEGLAQQINLGNVPDALQHKRVQTLHMGAMVASTKYLGEL